MALINCPNCGKQISDKAIKCPHCGLDLTVPYTTLQISGVAAKQKSILLETATATKKIRKILPILISGIGCVVIVLVAFWYFTNKEAPISNTTVPAATTECPIPYNKYYSGSIGTAQGCMSVDNNGQGSYTYDCNGTDLTRNIIVESYDNQTGLLLIKSYDKSGKYIGMFEGRLRNDSYSGVFTNYKGNTVDFYFEYNNR